MANIFLAWQNRADQGNLSGGSWQATLPLANLQNRQVQKVARSTDAAVANTLFDYDLVNSKSVGAVALVVHNISVGGRVRITAADSTAAWSNIVVGSNDLGNVAWTKTNATASTNVIAAPDGTTTADKLVENSGAGPHQVSQSLGALTGQRWAEVWLAAAGRTKARVRFVAGAAEASADIDLATGGISNAISDFVTVRAYADGWCKVLLADVFSSGTLTLEVTLLDASGSPTYTGDGSSGIYMWGARSSTGSGISDDSGYVQVWPAGMVAQDQLEWEDDNFWLGTITEEERESFQSPYLYRLPKIVNLRYWRVEVLDTLNPDGYVEIGRLFMAAGWTPSVNYSYGATLGYTDSTPIATSLSGAEFFDNRPRPREQRFTIQCLTETEAKKRALDMERVAGISGEVLVVPDGGEDPSLQPIQSFVGRLKQISGVTETQFGFNFNAYVKELL